MDQLNQFRKEKDEFFARHSQSPLTHEQKHAFQGLLYYPENPAFKIEATIERFPEIKNVIMQTSTGDLQSYQRYGRFQFDVGGQTAELTIYESDHEYFLPFVDTLAEKETYGAGRYLEPISLGKGKFLIDFNYAYNPYCAYNERWSCPIPPAENRLKVAIPAGEKIFKAH
jgi:uncharacterized protein (DUF1684 family)